MSSSKLPVKIIKPSQNENNANERWDLFVGELLHIGKIYGIFIVGLAEICQMN